MAKLSRNFSHREFECRCGCGYGQPHPELVTRLEKLRSLLGDKPLAIRSGVRCPPHNRAVQGATRSRHQSGEGVDLPSGLVREQMARKAGFTGIGLRNGWVTHVDIRRASEPVVWNY